VARELERRRPEILTAAWWKEERGERVFVDFNQNAPHKTVFGAWCVRARPQATVSCPLRWDDLADVHPDDLTLATVPARVAERGDPWAGIDEDPQSLDGLLELHERDRAAGLPDAPWPPVYPKMPGRGLARGALPGPASGPADAATGAGPARILARAGPDRRDARAGVSSFTRWGDLGPDSRAERSCGSCRTPASTASASAAPDRVSG
jgi:hypothetical protein